MSLNRHNPFVAALSSLVEPAPAAPSQPAIVPSQGTGDALGAAFLERIESWAALGQTHGGAPDAPSAELPNEATIEARTFQLFPYYY
jgi:hypothetical protein